MHDNCSEIMEGFGIIHSGGVDGEVGGTCGNGQADLVD